MKKTTPSQDQRNRRLRSDPTCSKCGKTKTVNDFQKNGVDYWCKDCRRQYAAELYRKKLAGMTAAEIAKYRKRVNDRQTARRASLLASMSKKRLAAYRGAVNAGNLRRREQIRHETYLAYGGYKCACCGETERCFLSIDHINNDGARHKREHRLRTGEQMYRWLKRNKYPAGFQILCMNCQWGKRNNGGICPHISDKV